MLVSLRSFSSLLFSPLATMSSYGPAKKQSRSGADAAKRTIAPYHSGGGGAGPLGAPKSAAAAAASSAAAKQKSASGAPDSRSQGFMFSA